MTGRAQARRAQARRRRRHLIAAVVATSLVATGAAVAVTSVAQANLRACYSGDLTIERWEDARGVVMFTENAAEQSAAAADGFVPTGDAFAASSTPQRGLVPLYDAYRANTDNHAWIVWNGEYDRAVDKGYDPRGVIGYVSPVPLTACDATAMTRAVRGPLHTVAVDGEEVSEALSEGYRVEYSWFAPTVDSALTAPPSPGTGPSPSPTDPSPTPSETPTPTPTPSDSPSPTPTPSETATPTPTPTPEPTQPAAGDGDGKFTIATYPDTQMEVFASARDRMKQRSDWLVAHKDDLDLRFVIHTGDIVNWDTDDHDQFVRAAAAMDPLERAGVPFQISIGNHDTMATGPGGPARDPLRTVQYQRDTATFNHFWSASDYGAVAGAFESGKVDNTYSTFDAEGAHWLVLNLELWPRLAVVDWASQVIASHPESNVIIQTHSFLNAAGDIDGAGVSSTHWSYGNASPQYVYDRLVAPYANVKVVTSGHVGGAVSKVVTTDGGNKVAYLLQALHSTTDNPVRLSTFDVKAGTIDTRIFGPASGSTSDAAVLDGLSFLHD